MLCPDCYVKKSKSVRLKVTNSRPDGPFKQLRYYECPKCGYNTWNTERLSVPPMKTYDEYFKQIALIRRGADIKI